MTGGFVTKNIVLCEDGKYRWIYEMSMLKNPVILFTLFRVLGMSFAILFIIGMIFSVVNGDTLDGFLGLVKITLICMGILLPLSIVSYLIYSLINGGKYIVLFEMDEKSVTHIQMKSQFKKAQAMGWIGAFAGLATGNLTLMGQGIMAATSQTSQSHFSHVKRVKTNRRRNVIYVNEALVHNQVYAGPEDFDFVENYIRRHCGEDIPAYTPQPVEPDPSFGYQAPPPSQGGISAGKLLIILGIGVVALLLVLCLAMIGMYLYRGYRGRQLADELMQQEQEYENNREEDTRNSDHPATEKEIQEYQDWMRGADGDE